MGKLTHGKKAYHRYGIFPKAFHYPKVNKHGYHDGGNINLILIEVGNGYDYI
jgi:hypothetical protein